MDDTLENKPAVILADHDEHDAVSEIQPEHMLLIKQLREQLGHLFVDEFHTDFDLLRWLQGHDFDVQQVVPKLKHHLRFRRAFDHKTYEWHPLVAKCFPVGMLDVSPKSNNFTFIDCTGRIDGEGAMRSIPFSHVILTTMARLETVALPMVRKREQATGCQSGIYLIMDLEHVGQNSVSVILTSYREFLGFFSQHYVELFRRIFCINAPTYIYYLWRLIKPLTPERTQRKVTILGSNWREELLQYVDADSLPVHWGGTLVDDSGDPMCRGKGVVVPVKVPKEMYWTQGPLDTPRDQLNQLYVPAGKKEYVTVSVKHENSKMKWYYFTDGDYSFGVYFTEDENNFDEDTMEMVYPHFNLLAPASKMPECETMECKKAGLYRLRFGNEHAWISRMRVSYKVDVLNP